MRKLDVFWIAIIVLLLFISDCEGRKTVVEKEIVRDTIQVVRVDTLVREKEVPIYVKRTVFKTDVQYIDTTSCPLVDTVGYRDTVFIDNNYYIWYLAKVAGAMEEIDIGIYDKRPDSLFTKTVTNTIIDTQYKYRNGWYLGGSVNTSSDITMGVARQWNKNWLQLGYDFNSKGLRVGYYWKFQ